MPYIKKEDRKKLSNIVKMMQTTELNNPGNFNYLITQLCLYYVADNGKSYKTVNDIIGALECAKQEFYRRFAAIYENEKIKENGDVY